MTNLVMYLRLSLEDDVNADEYKTLQQTENGLWAESAEYIADQYYEEVGCE